MPRPHRSRTFPTFAAAALVLVALALTAGPAAAHGDEGSMEVLTAEARSAEEIYVEVGVVYEGDEDLATEAEVTVTATGPDGATAGPVAVPVLEDAKYATTLAVPAPGTWTVTVTSEGPDASAEATVEVSEATVATTTPTTATPSTVAPTTDTSAAPALVGSDEPGTEQAATGSDDEDDTLGARLAIGALATVAAFGCLIGGVLWSRKRQAAKDATASGTGTA